jgi:hypothetical protein
MAMLDRPTADSPELQAVPSSHHTAYRDAFAAGLIYQFGEDSAIQKGNFF